MSQTSPRPNLLARSANEAGSLASQTITVTDPVERPGEGGNREGSQPRLVLRARPLGGTQNNQPRVQWSDNVVDNEGLGRKKSKVCCIYKKPRAFDESSDESDDSDSDCCAHRPTSSRPPPSESCNDASVSTSTAPSATIPPAPRPPNAYEVEPRQLKGKGKSAS